MLLPSRPSMVSVVVCLVLGLVLVAAAGLKLAGGARGAGRARDATASAIAARGVRRVGRADRASSWCSASASPRVRRSPRPPAALLMAGATAAQVGAILSGRSGRAVRVLRRARGRSARPPPGRAAALAAALALAPLLPREEPTTEQWLAIGLAVRAARARRARGRGARARARGRDAAALGRPARRARGRPRGPGGRRAQRARRRASSSRQGRIGLAVFTSEGCGLCRVARARDRRVRRAPERRRCARSTRSRDADAWSAADVPGSPFAVALDADGTVLAKGTFNTGAQLESVLARAGAPPRGGAAREPRGRADRRRGRRRRARGAASWPASARR